MATPGTFPTSFSKGDNFCYFLSPFMYTGPFLERKASASKGSICFRIDPFQMGVNNFDGVFFFEGVLIILITGFLNPCILQKT